MKKSNFAITILTTIGGVLFALGMCMTLIPEWNAFKPGIVFAGVGIVIGFAALIIWRKANHKAPVKISGKAVLTVAVGIVGALALGTGMCFCMVWDKMLIGILIGLAGIAVMLCLIPIIKGIKEE